VCAGLLPVTDGVAEVLGVDLVADRTPVRHRVGLVGHGGGLYDDLSVAENVAFWGRAAGATDEDVAGALARLGLDGRLKDLAVARLSAGQRRRTSIAAMVARRPELWLLDEPHASLDAEGRDLVDGLIADSVAAGATVLLASHEDERATAIATRIVEVRGGTTVPAEEPVRAP
jgi:ABC-type multidrug transport system ATPase subunit